MWSHIIVIVFISAKAYSHNQFYFGPSQNVLKDAAVILWIADFITLFFIANGYAWSVCMKITRWLSIFLYAKATSNMKCDNGIILLSDISSWSHHDNTKYYESFPILIPHNGTNSNFHFHDPSVLKYEQKY